MNCPHGVELRDCLACEITDAERAETHLRWTRECAEWNAIAKDMGAGVTAWDVTEEHSRRMRERGERGAFSSARAQRMIRPLAANEANCPHSRLVDGVCEACGSSVEDRLWLERRTEEAAKHETSVQREERERRAREQTNCPHVVDSCSECGDALGKEIANLSHAKAKPSNCPHGYPPPPLGLPCPLCPAAKPKNCPHVFDVVDADHGPNKCHLCGAVRLPEPERAHVALPRRPSDPTSSCAHLEWERDLHDPDRGWWCLACGLTIPATATRFPRGGAASACPHGFDPTDTDHPCHVCIAATLLEGKKARDLVHLLATCEHPKLAIVARGAPSDDRALEVEWCMACGATRPAWTEPPTPWSLPLWMQRAKELDPPRTSSGPPPDPSSPDSSPKKSS